MDNTNEVTRFISNMSDEQVNHFDNSLRYNDVSAEQLKQLRGALIEEVEPVFADYGKDIACALLLYIKNPSGQRQIIQVYTPEVDCQDVELLVSRAEYEINKEDK